MTIPSDNNPLKDHGDADDMRTTLTPEDFGGPHPVPDDYYHDQNHRDSREIFTWVIVTGLVLWILWLAGVVGK